MNRLPPFLNHLSPVGETLVSLEEGHSLLRAEVAARNDQLSVSSSTDGLSLWEADYSLTPERTIPARRSRILTAITGGQTLTPAQLASLAVTIAGADAADVEEDFASWRVILSALFHQRMPENIAPLAQSVSRLKPAHLEIQVQPVVTLHAHTDRYLALTGGTLMHIPCRNAESLP